MVGGPSSDYQLEFVTADDELVEVTQSGVVTGKSVGETKVNVKVTMFDGTVFMCKVSSVKPRKNCLESLFLWSY